MASSEIIAHSRRRSVSSRCRVRGNHPDQVEAAQVSDRGEEAQRRPEQQRPADLASHRRRAQAEVSQGRFQASQARRRRGGGRRSNTIRTARRASRCSSMRTARRATSSRRTVLTPGAKVMSGPTAPPGVGNSLPLSAIPLGSGIHNIEIAPGRGGQIARSAGQQATLSNREGGYAWSNCPRAKFAASTTPAAPRWARSAMSIT